MLSLLLAAASAQSQYRPGGGPSGSGGFGGSSGGFGGDYDAGASDFGAGGGGGGSDLEENIPGVPGDDYPIFAEVPDTSFTCDGQVEGGYYADPEAECQVFHICGNDGTGGLTKYSFLCPNGTLFNQQYFVCDWWFNVDCSLAEQFYTLNDQVASEREANSPAGSTGGFGGASGGYQSGGGAGQGGSGRGSSGGQGRRGGQGSASAPRGSYSSPSDGGFGGDFGSADAGYGAPAGDFGGSLGGYSGGRRRGARRGRDLDLSDAAELEQEEGEYDY